MPMAIPRPEHVEGFLNLPLVIMYWPMLVGTLIFFLLLARGHFWAAVPAGAIAIAVQAARLGIFS